MGKSENGIGAKYGLRRANFILDPEHDSEFYAPRNAVNIPEIVEGLRINLATGLPPRRLLWGLYGGGKTHTLFTVTNRLEALTDIHAVYVECPNVSKRSTFLHLYHDGIMASLGQDFVIGVLEQLVEN